MQSPLFSRALVCLRNVKSAAYVGGTMNNSAWQKHRACAMETSLERKAGALLMRFLDARRGSLPLNLGHGEPSKVFELWSYTRVKEQRAAHTSSQRVLQQDLHALSSLGPSRTPRPRYLHRIFPFGEGSAQAARLPLRCASPGQPHSASEHLFLEAFDNRPRV